MAKRPNSPVEIDNPGIVIFLSEYHYQCACVEPGYEAVSFHLLQALLLDFG